MKTESPVSSILGTKRVGAWIPGSEGGRGWGPGLLSLKKVARDQDSRSWGRKAKCASTLGPQGNRHLGSGGLASSGGAGCGWEALRPCLSSALSQEFQRQPPPLLQPLMLTARVRLAGLETPGSKRDQGWADWASRWGSRGVPPSPVPKGSGTPAVRQDEMQGMGRGRTL